MPKAYRNLALATTQSQHVELDHAVADMVDDLCGEDHEKADTLFALFDLCWNAKYDENSREGVLRYARRQAFYHSEACTLAIESESERVNPARQRKVG